MDVHGHVEVVVAKTLWTKAHNKVKDELAEKADVLAQIAVINLRANLTSPEQEDPRQLLGLVPDAPDAPEQTGTCPPTERAPTPPPRERPGHHSVMAPWALPFLWWVLDVSKPTRGVMHELDLPDADHHADAFEKR